ncbi:glutamate formimidoyltransferase [Herpetosiphon sp.]|uniref:Formimidoyltransferase-cyclodeaminase n=1 Tax=Herpetosiphon aurantiacus (strain ATCC 23779 / DSM 785 / 114-95) TaxID=316274 RepID=A9B6L2_HERA2|nr:glutamate formimidoyltransferase [Herpetosiphon sp.]ABX02915.1 glutamate formiminotransferase [Herpetosiphon aurantiacus DSM 785]
MGLVESIMNFSEGRRTEVVHAIRDAITAVAGVQLLDVQSDADHNRTVISFAGEAEAVGEAAFQATRTAQGLINLDTHRGEHPRIGATDVLPFVPLGQTTMKQCVALARKVGKRIGDELGIAVYLYEEAATRPERQNLADVRKGEYEAWRKAIGVDPAREPDFGPAVATPAGATVVGARQPLIAYNIYLNTTDVEIAKKIAKSIRYLGGGLRYVKALGLLVDGRAQISMNLVNFRGTPIHRVQELVRAEAMRYGVTITEGEVIGLVPQDALVDAAEHYLQLNRFRRDQVLESKLAAPSAGDDWLPTNTFQAFAAGTPTPGGGSAAALAGALAGSLGQMVANLTVSRKKYAAVKPSMQAALERLSEATTSLGKLALSDSAAFNAISVTRKLPEEQADRAQQLAAAIVHACEVPLQVAQQAASLFDDLYLLATQGNVNARTDAQVGGYLAYAAVNGAGLNVLVNLGDLSDAQLREQFSAAVAKLRQQAEQGLQKLTTL